MSRPNPQEIADSLGGPDDSSALTDDDSAPESDVEAAVADFCDALESKDYKAAAEALTHAVKFIMNGSSDSSEDTELPAGLEK